MRPRVAFSARGPGPGRAPNGHPTRLRKRSLRPARSTKSSPPSTLPPKRREACPCSDTKASRSTTIPKTAWFQSPQPLHPDGHATAFAATSIQTSAVPPTPTTQSAAANVFPHKLLRTAPTPSRRHVTSIANRMPHPTTAPVAGHKAQANSGRGLCRWVLSPSSGMHKHRTKPGRPPGQRPSLGKSNQSLPSWSILERMTVFVETREMA